MSLHPLHPATPLPDVGCSGPNGYAASVPSLPLHRYTLLRMYKGSYVGWRCEGAVRMCPPSKGNGRSGRSGVAASRHILDARRGSAQCGRMPLRRADRDHEQLAAWGEIRDAASDAFEARNGVEPIYVVAVGTVVHVTTSLAHLAAVTRRERHRWGVLWPEDGRR